MGARILALLLTYTALMLGKLHFEGTAPPKQPVVFEPLGAFGLSNDTDMVILKAVSSNTPLYRADINGSVVMGGVPPEHKSRDFMQSSTLLPALLSVWLLSAMERVGEYPAAFDITHAAVVTTVYFVFGFALPLRVVVNSVKCEASVPSVCACTGASSALSVLVTWAACLQAVDTLALRVPRRMGVRRDAHPVTPPEAKACPACAEDMASSPAVRLRCSHEMHARCMGEDCPVCGSRIGFVVSSKFD